MFTVTHWISAVGLACLLTTVGHADIPLSTPISATTTAANPSVDPDLFAIGEEEWELIGIKDGVETYRMRHQGTDVQTFKGVAFVDAKIEVIGEVLRDIPAYPAWMYKFKNTKILKTIDRNTYVFHTAIKTPFIYQDRDLVIENSTTYNFDNGTAVLDFWAAKDFSYPQQKGYFRIGLLEGTYLLEYFGRDKTRVSYQYRTNPGGNIPLAVANEVEIKHYPVHTLAALRQQASKEQYVRSGRASPEYDLIEAMLDDRAKVEVILKNRLNEYITDRRLIEAVIGLPEAQHIVDGVYKNRADFASIRDAMVGMFKLVSEIDQRPELNSVLQQLLNVIRPQEFHSFFNVEKFMQEEWLVSEIVQQPTIIKNLLSSNSEFGHELFEKITTSEVAVKAFIRSKRLAYKILENAEVRRQLWADQTLRQQLTAELSKMKTLRDFEDLIASRVKTY